MLAKCRAGCGDYTLFTGRPFEKRTQRKARSDARKNCKQHMYTM